MVGDRIVADRPADVAALMNLSIDGSTVEQARTELVAKIGENITVRRFEVIEASGTVGVYVHMNRIGVLVEIQNGSEDLAKDVAMQIAATSPQFVSIDDVPAEAREKEREILSAQALQEGKPPEIVAKMVEGRLRKHFDEVTLLGQPFVKNPDQKVRDLLKQAGASVTRFVRYAVGEGIEKKQENFADEVAALQ
jgi:elongation factor Ts